MLNLTRQERLVIQFLALFFLIGCGIYIIRNLARDDTPPDFQSGESEAREFKERADLIDSVYFSKQSGQANQAPTVESESVGRLNLNSATKTELMRLPNIGEVTAQRIIDYRNTHQGFSSVDELIEVKGIGDKTFKRIKDEVSVE
jgi:comEA protein